MSYLFNIFNKKDDSLDYEVTKCITKDSLINLPYNNINAYIDDTFDLFKSVKNEYFLVYSSSENFTKYSLIFYDMKKEQINIKIGNAHNDRIYTCRHFFDKNSKSDLILTSSYDRWIKIWNVTNYYTLVYKKCPDYDYNERTYLLSEKILYYNQRNYLITSAYEIYSKGFNILFYDYEGNTDKTEIKNSEDNTNYLGVYYDNKTPYILAGNYGNIKVFDFSKKELFNKYEDNNAQINYLSIIIKENENNKILLASGADGYLRIWEYKKYGNLLYKVLSNIEGWIIGLNLLNENYILEACFNGSIAIYDLKSNKIVSFLKSNLDFKDDFFINIFHKHFLCVKNIDIDKKNYLVTHCSNGLIELWKKK